ncbi:hypothetical protein AVEN_237233-1, partial [Araneus ventricosus]
MLFRTLSPTTVPNFKTTPFFFLFVDFWPSLTGLPLPPIPLKWKIPPHGVVTVATPHHVSIFSNTYYAIACHGTYGRAATDKRKERKVRQKEVGNTFDLLSNENHQTPKPARSLRAQSEERNDSSTETEVGSNVATSKAAVCQNRIHSPKVEVECDRYGVSDREAAAIVSAALQDSGQLKNDDLTLVVDRSKIRRKRKRVRNELKCDSLTEINQNPVCGLYFDGRK